MTNRMTLLAAVGAIALPAAMAIAQGTEHRPLGSPSATSTRPAPRTPRTTHTPPAPTANTATEDAQPNAQPAETPAAVNRNAEPGTQADTGTQAATQAQTPPTGQPAAAAQAQTSTQAQIPPAEQPAPAAQAGTQAQAATTAPATAAAVRVATAADLHSGVQVRDQAGGVVGTVESADASGAVVSTGTVRARLPLASFGANGQWLVISMTRGQLEAAAAHAQPQHSAG